MPYVAMAALSDLAAAPKCAIKNALRSVLGKIGEAIRTFLKAAIKSAICKGVSALTGIPLSCKPPQKVQDPSSDILATKEIVYDPIARCVSLGVLNKTVAGILNIVRTQGRDGGPAFVQNWRNFQLDAQYRGEDIFRSSLAGANLCDYFGKDLKKTFGAQNTRPLSKVNTRAGNLDSFAARQNCTLPEGFNIDNYKKDFSKNGGWEAWSRLLEPQNNFYGSYFQALDEAKIQRSIEEQGDLNEALSGRGFTSVRGSTAQDSCQIAGANGRCLVYKDIKQPGSILSDSVSTTIEKELEWVVSSDELNELLVDVSERLVLRLGNLLAPDKEVPVEILGEEIGGQFEGGPLPEDPEETSPPSGGGAEPPADALQKHPDKSGVVAEAKQEAEETGIVYSRNSPECPDRFEITKRAAWKLRGEGAGLLSKTSGNNCQGYSVDLIIYPDGYIYDILNGTAPDGNGPAWIPAGCGPSGGNGTCPDLYRQAISP